MLVLEQLEYDCDTHRHLMAQARVSLWVASLAWAVGGKRMRWLRHTYVHDAVELLRDRGTIAEEDDITPEQRC